MDFYRPPTTQGALDALSNLYRAVRAWRFYPKGHPTRRSSLAAAHAAMQQLMDGHALSLACGRTGFSYPDGEFLKDTSTMSAALAYEFFIRRIQKITFCNDLFQEDLLELFKILCTTPETIHQSGGVDTIMAARGIRSIWVNEFDLTTIQNQRLMIEESGVIPAGIDEAETIDDTPPADEPPPEELTPEQQLAEWLGRLTDCTDDDLYLMLIRHVVASATALQFHQKAQFLFPLLELLDRQARDVTRSKNIREYAHFAIEQIVTSGDTLKSVLEQTGQDIGLSVETLHAVLKAGGTTAITLAIELTGRTTSIKVRKILATALGGLGETAVPALLNAMNDTRWFITRNICVILGAIASNEALPALTHCLHHEDLRVQKEALRSLAHIGGPDAENSIITLLHGSNSALHPQAITSLGAMKSRKSLPLLMNILFSRDIFLKSLPLKISALAAITLIGDRQVTPHLVMLLEERHLLATERWKQLKAALAVSLGKLGDNRAIPTLKKLLTRNDELGTACSEAVALIERAGGKPDGIS